MRKRRLPARDGGSDRTGQQDGIVVRVLRQHPEIEEIDCSVCRAIPAPPGRRRNRSCTALEAVGNLLGNTSDTDGHAIRNVFLDTLSERCGGETHNA